MTSRSYNDVMLDLSSRLFRSIEIEKLGRAYACFGSSSVFIFVPEVRKLGQLYHLRGFFGFGMLPLNDGARTGCVTKGNFSFIPVENVPDLVRLSGIQGNHVSQDLKTVLETLAENFRNDELLLTDAIQSISTLSGPAIYPALGKLLKRLQQPSRSS